MESRQYYVYILTNKHNTTLYIGVTNALMRRVYEHQMGMVPGFTRTYKLKKLVYFEATESLYAGRDRERQLKNWRRE